MRSVSPPLTEIYKLLKWDSSGDVYVVIKQVRQAEDMRRNEVLLRTRIQRPTDSDPIELVEVPIGDLVFLECYLSFQEGTISYEEPIDPAKPEKGSKFVPVFTKDMPEADFRKRFDALDPALVREWQEAVRKQNPQWSIGGGGGNS